jgi:hypothetical protein
MTRLRGQRLVMSAPHGHWRTISMIFSVRLDGTSSCMTIDEATNTEVFQVCVREILVPALRPSNIMVMDNLGTHKNEAILVLITVAGAQTRFHRLSTRCSHRKRRQGLVCPLRLWF